MILCQCAAVDEKTVLRLIGDGAQTLAEIRRRCGAGKNCPPCQEEIIEMIRKSKTERPSGRRSWAGTRHTGVELTPAG